MYIIIRNVIESGRYELSDMLKKIDIIWIQGDITGDQKKELEDMAREKANPENSYAAVAKQLETIFENLGEMARNILELSGRITALEGGEPELPQEEEYPEYRQPLGGFDAYHKGDKITFKEERYRCIAPSGVAVIWNPEQFPAYWEKAVEVPADPEVSAVPEEIPAE